MYSSAQRDILVGIEQVARESMDRARIEIESIYKLVSSNNRIHCVASYDGASLRASIVLLSPSQTRPEKIIHLLYACLTTTGAYADSN